VALNEDALGIALYVLTMLCVGFLEEIIFRGLLFRAMRKDSLTAAVIVSSITFGIGHIINLINGSGAELIPNILQVMYATAAGFMFVMIYLVSDSLILCAAAHGIFNSLSIIAKEPGSLDAQIISCVALSLITGLYALYLVFVFNRTARNNNKKPE
jgi:membrane protease YdiL (CAAX protease family)